jgi:hypothetical protein
VKVDEIPETLYLVGGSLSGRRFGEWSRGESTFGEKVEV